MNKFAAATVLAVAGYFGAGIAEAQAADGGLCYSAVQSMTTVGGPGTTNYPQLTNDTRFACLNSSVGYTMRQLAQAGWEISIPVTTLHSTTVTSEGVVTQRTRWQLTIQR